MEQISLITTLLMLLCLNVSKALDCELNPNDPNRVAYTIVVDKSGSGNFRTIQSAIDSIPSQNSRWIRIQISSGIYLEKVHISEEKSCIFLDGAGRSSTEIRWNDHATTATSATFTSIAENLVVKGITFKNTYNAPGSVKRQEDIAPAVAALIEGDKGIFHKCGFVGLQDTLWDGNGRHRYTECYIEGVIDVISGAGQSIYESISFGGQASLLAGSDTICNSSSSPLIDINCEINVPVDLYAPVIGHGYITAQGKEDSSQTNGFVFIGCSVIGSGTVYLGRAYRPFSTVIYYSSFLSACIDPAGWDPWEQVGHEASLTCAETHCVGLGADTSKRVSWLKKLSIDEIRHFTSISFIDQEGWTSKLPLF